MNDLLQLNSANLSSNNKIHTVITSIVTKKNQLNNKRAASDLCTNAKRLKVSPSTDRQMAASPVSPIQSPLPNSTLSPPRPSSVSSSQSSPQLLQQLMAPSPVPQKTKPSTSKFDASRWTDGQMSGLHHEQTSNSVLMNLLVSGCDVSAGYTCFPRPSKAAKA